MDFASDNAGGASPRILDAIVAANGGFTPAYGEDDYTRAATKMLSETFERPCAVFLVATGTAANALALAAVTPPWGAVFCHEDAHISDDECGAPEFFSGGAKLVGLHGPHGKITPEILAATLAKYPRGLVKQVQPAALSLAQATECGAVYSPAETARLADLAHEAGLAVHMDGARFANAVEALGCTPAQASWQAGVDVLSFGATKNGALACEAVIVFDPDRAADLAFRRKRAGHTLSKGRFLGAQMKAYLEGGHWRELARAANAAATRLADGLAAIPGVRMPWPRQINEVFVVIPAAMDRALRQAGARYHDWGVRGLTPMQEPGADEVFVRLVASCSTTAEQVDGFLRVARAAAGRQGRPTY
ncbi:MAG: low specificity L-threonine aldolase [Beijerinckiaceae bacterium]|jgi:threonine aldolase|nr:low specificity L-threonine aldolase [Beijerinckiaceae bacterium]